MTNLILIVDDDENTSHAFFSILARFGYKAVVAHSYYSAVDLLTEQDFDLIISDIVLGGKSGVDLLGGNQKHGHFNARGDGYRISHH